MNSSSKRILQPADIPAVYSDSRQRLLYAYREHVLENIRYYLKQTDLSVKQIADLLGFPNTSFFGKYVKEHFGMTPIQFRQQG